MVDQATINSIKSLIQMSEKAQKNANPCGFLDGNETGYQNGIKAVCSLLGINLEREQLPKATTEAMDKVAFDFGYDVTDADVDFQGLVGYRHKGNVAY